jgi:hypothetical protein
MRGGERKEMYCHVGVPTGQYIQSELTLFKVTAAQLQMLCSMLSTSGGCTMATTEKLNYDNVCDGGMPHVD